MADTNLPPELIEQLREFTQAVRDSTGALNESGAGFDRYLTVQERAERAAASEAQRIKAEADRRIAEEKAALEAAIGKWKKAGDATVNFARSASTVEGAFNQIGATSALVVTSLTSLAKNIPFVGAAIAGLGKGAGEVVKFVTEQTGKAFGTFEKLSKSGIVENFESMRNAADRTGLMFGELEQVIGKNSESLALLGTSALDGSKKMQNVLEINRKSAEEFQKLGVGFQEFSQIQSDYVAMQTRAGFARGKSDKELAAGAKEYAEQLTAISRLTGKSREQLQKEQDKRMTDVRFRSKLAQMAAKGDEEGAKRLQRMMDMLPAEMSEGLKNMIAAGGAVTEKSAAELAASFGAAGTDIVGLTRKFDKGQITVEEFVQSIAKGSKDYMDKVGPQLGTIVGADSPITKNLVAFADTALLANKNLKEVTAEIEKGIKAGQAANDPTAKVAQQARDIARDIEHISTGTKTMMEAVSKVGAVMKEFTGYIKDFTDGKGGTAAVYGTGAAIAASAVAGIVATVMQYMAGKKLLESLTRTSTGGAPLPGGGAPTGGAPGAGPKKVLSTAAKGLGRLAGPLAAVVSVADGLSTAASGMETATKELQEGKITKEEAREKKGEAIGAGTGTAAGGTAGALGGAKAGALIGAVAGPVGIAVGGILGAAVGGWLGAKGGKAIGEAAGGSIAKMTADADKKVDESILKSEAKKEDAKGQSAKDEAVRVTLVNPVPLPVAISSGLEPLISQASQKLDQPAKDQIAKVTLVNPLPLPVAIAKGLEPLINQAAQKLDKKDGGQFNFEKASTFINTMAQSAGTLLEKGLTNVVDKMPNIEDLGKFDKFGLKFDVSSEIKKIKTDFDKVARNLTGGNVSVEEIKKTLSSIVEKDSIKGVGLTNQARPLGTEVDPIKVEVLNFPDSEKKLEKELNSLNNEINTKIENQLYSLNKDINARVENILPQLKTAIAPPPPASAQLSSADKNWLGGANPNDPYILARAPNKGAAVSTAGAGAAKSAPVAPAGGASGGGSGSPQVTPAMSSGGARPAPSGMSTSGASSGATRDTGAAGGTAGAIDASGPGGAAPAGASGAPAGIQADGITQYGNRVRIGNTIREGGTVSWRTNNPGNVSYLGLARKHGAIGRWMKPDGDLQQRTTGIAIMPTMEAGDELKKELWRRPLYSDTNIATGVHLWTRGSKSPDLPPDVKNYAKDLAAAAGVDINTPIPALSDDQLGKMIKKQRVWEGFKEGRILQAANGALIQPQTGGTLVNVAEAGKAEAIVPLPDGRTIPVTIKNSGEQAAALRDLFDGMNMRLDEVIDLLSQGNKLTRNIAMNSG